MKSIAFLCIWFGKMPDFLPVWLKSCEKNPTIDFYFFTDIEDSITYPTNVRKIQISFRDFCNKFTEPYGVTDGIAKPYKLCDVRPAFGEILGEYVKGYDYWGYCDEDLVWGDIRHFFTDDILEKHDRILTRGHCSVFRNTPEVNAYYRTLPRKGHMEYQETLLRPEVCAFDEWAEHMGGGVSAIFRDNGIAMYNEPVMADIYTAKGNFEVNYRPDLKGTSHFLYEDGKVYACGKNRQQGRFQTEVLYCHFQKRKISVDPGLNYEHFIFEPVGHMRNVDAKPHRLKETAKVMRINARYHLRRIYGKIRGKR
ncbi:MAG: DUF6625 family protein [Roseburia sp.]